GRTSIWADALHDGPVPAGLSDDELLDLRARALGEGPFDPADVAAAMRQWRQDIDRHDRYDELVLWYEHDLFDQLNVIQLLSRIGENRPWPRPVTLICIGSFPGRLSFKGLGELSVAELAPLFDTRERITDAYYDLAAAAWAAFRSPDPGVIETVLASDTSALPFLAPALAR